MKLSIGLITYNEEKNLARTLDSIIEIANEIIIVDSGSTDKTLEIADRYNASIYSEEWKGYGMQKNSVIEKCGGEWILLIDADEEISRDLRNKIKEIISDKNSKKIYKPNFTAVCFGKRIKHGGWSNHYRIRLFQKGAGKYNDREVHEKFITNEEIGILKEEIYHHTYEDLEDYFNKFNRYTSESANQYKKQNKKKSFVLFYLDSLFKFFKMYVLKLGFLDGYEGYLLAKLSSFYVFTKYAKLKEKNLND
ncbi:glycosyltransferase family 2 protein [Sebaldella termitidis]|uniref:glycosyltransferase family 2 protein n=1 Tax=Sebaldella termitidis TaxID=826 RepID=UPI003EBB40F9